MRRRNPDEQAYRAWQADRSDRESLQRYLLSMARDREILDDPERIVELDEAVGQNEALRPIYTRVRPDYSNAATPFREERWRTLVDRYAGRQLDHRAALVLVEMGLRSGASMEGVYRVLCDRKIIARNIGMKILNLIRRRSSYDVRRRNIASMEFVISALPALMHVIENDERNDIRWHCIGVILNIYNNTGNNTIIEFIIRNLENDAWEVRDECAQALGRIGCVSAESSLIRTFLTDDDIFVRSRCAGSLLRINPYSEDAVLRCIEIIEELYEQDDATDLICELFNIMSVSESLASVRAVSYMENELSSNLNYNIRRYCADSLGMMGNKAKSALDCLINSAKYEEDYCVRESCLYSIMQITGSPSQFVPHIINSLSKDHDYKVRHFCALTL